MSRILIIDKIFVRIVKDLMGIFDFLVHGLRPIDVHKKRNLSEHKCSAGSFL